MSDESRTLPPTPRRLEEARREGLVAKSPALTAALVFLTGVITLAPIGAAFLGELLRSSLSTLDGASEMNLVEQLSAAAFSTAWALLPFAVAVVLVAILSQLAQTGFLWRGVAFRSLPKPERSLWRPFFAVLCAAAVGLAAWSGERTLTAASIRVGLALVVLGILDYAVQRRRIARLLMMTRDEVVREQRESMRAGVPR